MFVVYMRRKVVDNHCGKMQLKFFSSWSFLVHSPRTAQGLLHEPLLGKAGPPLGGFPIRCFKHFLAQPLACFMSQLKEVLSHQISHLWAGWPLVHSIQRESWISRDVKSGDGKAVHLLQPLSLARTLLQLLQALCDVEGQVDEHPVRLRLYFVSAEEDVCLEVVKCFIYNVRLFRHWQARSRASERTI